MFDDIIKPKKKFTIFDFTYNVQLILEYFKYELKDTKTLDSIKSCIRAAFKELRYEGKIENGIITKLDDTELIMHIKMEEYGCWEQLRFEIPHV